MKITLGFREMLQVKKLVDRQTERYGKDNMRNVAFFFANATSKERKN
jgi:hypothetical protein